MSWDKKVTKELMDQGLSWEHARIAIGFLAEHRQTAYMEGYSKGFDEATKGFKDRLERFEEFERIQNERGKCRRFDDFKF